LALLSPDPPGPAGPAQRARWQVSRASALYWGLDRRTDAVEALRAGAEHPGTWPAQAMMLLFDARCQDAFDTARRALDAPDLPLDARLWASTAAVLAAAHLGHVTSALEQADHGLRLAATVSSEVPVGAVHLRIAEGGALVFAGRLAQ